MSAKKPRAVIGLHACAEVMKIRPQGIVEVWLRREFERSAELRSWAEYCKKKHIPLKFQNEASLDKIGSGHQGLAIFVVDQPHLFWDQIKTASTACLLALDEIEDPHNVGAILRTAWLFGADAVLVPQRRSAHLTPAVAKVASGGAEHVPIEIVDNLSQTLSELKNADFWVYGLSAAGKQGLWNTLIPEKVVWVFGSEESGLRTTTERQCDELIQIFQIDPRASFNVSVAAGVVLAETVRQRKVIEKTGK